MWKTESCVAIVEGETERAGPRPVADGMSLCTNSKGIALSLPRFPHQTNPNYLLLT